jgi:hypothetical protein
MYCINCGAQIPENSKFCPHCGYQQSHNIASIKEKLAEKIIEREIVRQINDEYQSSINFQFLKKSIGWYLAWVLLHLAFLLIWADNIISDGSEFYPFSEFSDIGDYDIREFLVYTIFPLVCLLIISMVQTSKTEAKQNKVIDPTTYKSPESIVHRPQTDLKQNKVTYPNTNKSPEKIFEEKMNNFNLVFTLIVVIIIVLLYLMFIAV